MAEAAVGTRGWCELLSQRQQPRVADKAADRVARQRRSEISEGICVNVDGVSTLS